MANIDDLANEVVLLKTRIQFLEDKIEEMSVESLLSESEKQAFNGRKQDSLRKDWVVKQAEIFVRDNEKGHVSFDFGTIFYHIKFRLNKNKRTVTALLIGDYTDFCHKKITVKCHPDDEFNEHIGKAIAVGRLLGKGVLYFENY